MKSRRKQWIFTAIVAVVVVVLVVLYIILPLHRRKLNQEAVAGQAASYYSDEVSEMVDSAHADEARELVDGER